ncbi:MAG: PIG-L family deacetylase [Candidatus Berkelbacteria bacterium]|nr:PIG-L family deacetylase [Candidatus Berkelbacteria bacterium]
MAFYQKETEKKLIGIVPEVLKTRVISQVRADRVLVLSPHPDDDALGCGGILKMLSDNGAKIKVIYFSDGSQGNRENKSDVELVEVRENEAREAGKILGVGEEKFLRLPDTRLTSDSEIVTQIRREIEFEKYDLILAPSFDDPHPDHHAVAVMLGMALRNFDQHINIWLYEIWGTGRINRLFLIDKLIDDKIEALRQHKSQMKVKRYDEAVMALNHFRALSAGVGEYAEAFWVIGPREYRKLVEVFGRHHQSRN